ncbi:hypothetical protein CABS01_11436 [Colletotrichum abscissum]|uniref:uncharacterized protein n=1 Tax=Colletotrichum abscissum TaxID=1671311 RepID=UPI0027D69D19|nr:uncharacterized protein CABS01_11436 [Colletotrichum abscissum]KAK1494420.1 hypothetical protein CABS01_11436 [Colletotrichum abscissum]
MGVERVEWSQDCAGQGHHGDPGPAAIFSCSSVFSLAFFPLHHCLQSALSISVRLRITVRYYAMPLSAGGAKLTGPDRSTSQTRAVTVSLALTPAPAPAPAPKNLHQHQHPASSQTGLFFFLSFSCGCCFWCRAQCWSLGHLGFRRQTHHTDLDTDTGRRHRQRRRTRREGNRNRALMPSNVEAMRGEAMRCDGKYPFVSSCPIPFLPFVCFYSSF